MNLSLTRAETCVDKILFQLWESGTLKFILYLLLIRSREHHRKKKKKTRRSSDNYNFHFKFNLIMPMKASISNIFKSCWAENIWAWIKLEMSSRFVRIVIAIEMLHIVTWYRSNWNKKYPKVAFSHTRVLLSTNDVN